jgi:hypothetical protein
MVKLAMGIWAGIAAGSVMVMLCLIPILGYIFSRSKKAKQAEMESSAAEKGEVIVDAAPALAKPSNVVPQKQTLKVSQHEIGEVRTKPSTQSMTPSYHSLTPSSQASTLSPLRNTTPSPPHMQPHMQPLWSKP